MGRAIVRHAQAFLFDEPLSNLDAKLRMKTRVEIRDLQQRLGTTSIYVTHDQLEAMTLADKLVVLNGGRIEQIGPPLEIYARPVNTFVANFVGNPPMNFLSAETTAEGVRLANGALLTHDHPHAGTLTVGLRPEALRVAEDGPLRLVVRVVEQLGAAVNVHGTLEGGDEELVAILPGRHVPTPGEALPLAPEPGAVHLFDARSGLRL
jgi:sn-glycerol 3-phosphate transport system ATP-binding protein